MPTARNVAVAIGIGDAKPLPFMGGALTGAREFHEWASRLGYESRLVTDEAQPVTVTMLRMALEAALSPLGQPIHRFLIYFAGHGQIREAEEGLWLLSDWNQELKAVAVEGLKRRLYMHDIEQLAIFSDSCRSLPPTITAADLVPDAVLGRGPRGVVQPAIDKFVAAQDGSVAFMVPGPTPDEDRCIFSGVLMEGLWGARPEAFSMIEPDKVTSRSLGKYLKTEVPRRAQIYKCTLDPSVSPTFPEGDDIYFGGFDIDARPPPPTFPAWPLPTVVKNMGFATTVMNHTMDEAVKARTRKSSSTLNRIRNQPRPTGFETRAGFAVEGGTIRAVWTRHAVMAEPHGAPNWWRLWHDRESILVQPEPVLIEFEDDLFAATTAIPEFISSLLRDERGMLAQVYRPVTYGPGAPPIGDAAELAIAKMETDSLRIDDAADFAVKLREFKHIDPVLGVVSAYLYDSIGDLDNIRRMAYYYTCNAQPIPYDIALLGQLDAEWRDGSLWGHVPPVRAGAAQTAAEHAKVWTHGATPAASGPVAGLWPWMRQGWLFLDDPSDKGRALIRPELNGLLEHLRLSRFTTFSQDGGQALMQIFDLVQRHDPAGLAANALTPA